MSHPRHRAACAAAAVRGSRLAQSRVEREYHPCGWRILPSSSSVMDVLEELSAHATVRASFASTFSQRYSYRSDPAFLSTKLYPSRGDIRAFVADSDVSRDLAGSILTQLLQPGNVELKRKFKTYEYIDVQQRKRVEISEIEVTHKECAVRSYDVSSFTANHTSYALANTAVC
jgi:hypothetical protein